MMEEQLLENPGQLLPMQISDDDEWYFYLDVMEKLDLPPDTGAVLITPSAFKEMKLYEYFSFLSKNLKKDIPVVGLYKVSKGVPAIGLRSANDSGTQRI